VFTWRELAGTPHSKLDDDAFTRVRIILMNGVEANQGRFLHACARMNRDLQPELARVRRVDHFQQVMVNWLLPPDLSPLETTIAFEQVAVEVTASAALAEPNPYLAQAYRFGMLEDYDHLYRFAALLDRLEGKDANSITQCYTDISPGRPTSVEHRAPEDDLRDGYDKATAAPISKLNALLITAAEHQTRDYYMTIGPQFADPVARALYAEIASIEEQHVTHYESLSDTTESWLEKWLLHECTEVWAYWSCHQAETNPRFKAIWERMLAYELGQLHHVMQLFKTVEQRDPAEIVPATLPDAVDFRSHRQFVRDVLSREVDLRAVGTRFVEAGKEPADGASARQRAHLNAGGSPSEAVAAGYRWAPGGEINRLLGAIGATGRA
jgi:hypothetical protein